MVFFQALAARADKHQRAMAPPPQLPAAMVALVAVPMAAVAVERQGQAVLALLVVGQLHLRAQAAAAVPQVVLQELPPRVAQVA